MIILGQAIHRKHNRTVAKIAIATFVIIILSIGSAFAETSKQRSFADTLGTIPAVSQAAWGDSTTLNVIMNNSTRSWTSSDFNKMAKTICGYLESNSVKYGATIVLWNGATQTQISQTNC